MPMAWAAARLGACCGSQVTASRYALGAEARRHGRCAPGGAYSVPPPITCARCLSYCWWGRRRWAWRPPVPASPRARTPGSIDASTCSAPRRPRPRPTVAPPPPARRASSHALKLCGTGASRARCVSAVSRAPSVPPARASRSFILVQSRLRPPLVVQRTLLAHQKLQTITAAPRRPYRLHTGRAPLVRSRSHSRARRSSASTSGL